MTLVFALFATVASFAQAIKFEAKEINYGAIKQGNRTDPEASRVFKFKNTGKNPLSITSARGSCGCTVPSYPKEPIAPGATGEIKVTYDINRIGAFTKTVTLTTNAVEADQKTVKLMIKGTVESK